MRCTNYPCSVLAASSVDSTKQILGCAFHSATLFLMNQSKYLKILFVFTDVQPINKEVGTGTETTISCVITGTTKQLDAVVWRKEGSDVTTLSETNYVVSAGSYSSNSQTTTLTVKAAANTADSIYTCVITSSEWLVTNRQTDLTLDVFGKHF